MAEFGHVDVLVNNAGIGTAVPATRETPEQFRQVDRRQPQRLLLDGAGLRPGDAAGQQHRQHQQRPRAHHRRAAAGGVLRHARPALIGLTRDLAQQWTGRKGIRVNALAPGFFASEMTDTYPEGYLDQAMAAGARPAARARARELAAAAGVPGQRRRRLRHRPDAGRRRRHDDHLTGSRTRSPTGVRARLGTGGSTAS